MTTTRFAGRILPGIVAAALSAAACTGAASPTTTFPPSTTTSTVATTTSPPDAVPVCLAGEIDFGATGLVGTPGEDGGDAGRLAGISWQTLEGCERIVLEFVTADGAPASLLGPASAQLRDDAGILRLTLPPEISRTTLADGRVDGDLVERYVVVRDDEGALFVDLLLTASARETGVRARAFDVDAPARAIVDLRPGGNPATSAPTVTDTAVLTFPAPGGVALPFLIRGYARDTTDGAEAVVLVDGSAVATASAAGADRDDAWRTFETVIAAGPPGPAVLVVTVGDVEVMLDIEITG